MIYTEARSKIASGDLLAWSHRGWRSFYDFEVQMVRMFTRSEYCHVGIAWRCAERVFVLEAVQTGVRIFPLSRLAPFYWVPLKVEWTAETEDYALSKVGERYSKVQAVLAFLGLLPPEPDNQWQCVEYVSTVLSQVKQTWVLGVDFTPSKIVRAAQENDHVVFYVGPDG